MNIQVAANISLMFGEHEFMERPRIAKNAGFDAIEAWWPFGDNPRPAVSAVSDFIHAVKSADIRLVAMNLFGGDMMGGQRGVLSYPEREEDFKHSVQIAMRVGEELGTRLFNAPYGLRRAGLDIASQDSQGDRMLSYAATEFSRINGTVLLEALSGWADYPLKSTKDAKSVIERVSKKYRNTTLKILIDQYHVENNGGDPIEDFCTYKPDIGHVQVASTADRGEPTENDGGVEKFVDCLCGEGYEGVIAFEYIPRVDTESSLVGWPQRWKSRWDLMGLPLRALAQ